MIVRKDHPRAAFVAEHDALAADPRLEAAAREWCAMIGMDPDALTRGWGGPGKRPRWQGYLRNAARIVRAADERTLPPLPSELQGN
jgi:hypothetical protein